MNLKELSKQQKRKFLFSVGLIIVIAVMYISYAIVSLYTDRKAEDDYWLEYMKTPKNIEKTVLEEGRNSTKVHVGTYIENLKEINIKGSSFRASYNIWFKWEGSPKLDMMNHFHVYKGSINKMEVLKEYHDDRSHYQKVRVDVTVTKNFWTKRFPLESHQLRMYVMSNYPIEEVSFIGDIAESGSNPNLSITGYDLTRFGSSVTGVTLKGTGDPTMDGDITMSEYMTAIEINRTNWGLYVKCFIALVGTITWVMIALFICSYHHVDPLGMIPAALFGTVTNIMVGANLLPDAMDLGLLEYINFYGILVILSVALVVINTNHIRVQMKDIAFAGYYGRRLFYVILFFVLVGFLLIPLSAYMF